MSITPGSFDAATARAIVGDEQARLIETKARGDADVATFRPPPFHLGTYWGGVQSCMQEAVYRDQYEKRIARNERKKTPVIGAKAKAGRKP